MTAREGLEIRARGIVEGRAAGPALIGDEAISFLGDVDIATGQIVGDLPSLKNASVRGTVLIFPYTRGSAGAWRFLYQLYKHANHPVAIITEAVPDPSVVQGAILANIPILCAPQQALKGLVVNGTRVAVEVAGATGVIRIEKPEGRSQKSG
jgi:predicted aconitase with swiveling domain